MAVTAAAVVVLVLILGSGGSGYRVHALFSDAGQLVKGDRVTVGGVPIGSISDIELDARNRADVTLQISDSHYDPLHQGTVATIRTPSLSTEASRFVSLAPGPNNAPKIGDGGAIGAESTQGIVDLDALFNALDAKTRENLQEVVHGSAAQYAGATGAANRTLAVLNPALAQTQALTGELLRDEGRFTDFIVKSAAVVSAIAPRDGDLQHGITSAAALTNRIAQEDKRLGDALGRAPAVLHQATGTLAHAQTALATARPTLRAAQPVAPLLASVLRKVEPVAREAQPVVSGLSAALPDLDTVLKGLPKLDKTGSRAFADTSTALNGAKDIVAALRPYTPDIVSGLFDGFGGNVGGYYDANGRYARIEFALPPDFTVQGLGGLLGLPVGNLLDSAFGGGYKVGAPDYCPGGSTIPADSSAPFLDPAVKGHCDPGQTPKP